MEIIFLEWRIDSDLINYEPFNSCCIFFFKKWQISLTVIAGGAFVPLYFFLENILLGLKNDYTIFIHVYERLKEGLEPSAP